MPSGQDLISLMHAYAVAGMDARTFCENYLTQWRSLRDSGQMAREEMQVQRGLDIVFTAIDAFDTDTAAGEDDSRREAILRAEVRAVLSMLTR